ncbi:MAG: PD-(D/E)XK nuclease superfamily protein [Thermosynechococcaceae cyanobacterium]
MKIFPKLKSEDLKHEVCRILDMLGLHYQTERYSAHNSSIIGKRRRVDVAILDSEGNVLMHIECKNQNVAGTTEDKLFKAVEEANRDKRIGTPSIIVVGGFGWSEADMRHALLNGSVRIEMLEDWLTLYMNYQKQVPNCIQPAVGDLAGGQQAH